MTETKNLINTLKIVLKSKGITYNDIAEQLKISTPSVKRVFSEGTFTLDRLEKICSISGISISELVKMNQSTKNTGPQYLTLEQEEFLAQNPKCFAYYNHLKHGVTVLELTKKYNLDDKQTTYFLSTLEKNKLIERLPKDKIRLLESNETIWRENGPLREAFLKRAKKEFFDSEFNEEHSHMRFKLCGLSQSTIKKLHKKFDKIAKEVLQTSDLENDLDVDRNMVGVVLAVRPWMFSVIDEL
jgi:transcriptional regulator with XRE-family HTH domain